VRPRRGETGFIVTFQQGVVFGTTVARAVQMAGEANLALAVVVP
jgi:hypothetical protein